MSSSESSEISSVRSDELYSSDEDEDEFATGLILLPQPKGPDASLRKGPSLANLSKRLTLHKGPNPNNRHGPDPTLRNGPDPKNHSGTKWRMECQNMTWRGPKADMVLLKQKKRRKHKHRREKGTVEIESTQKEEDVTEETELLAKHTEV
ncbi:uncharacterized protein LOC135369036 [Ornithodoros turicata]|uniref:uncharacterized protein LOC135369036 n=1 Tax=Ornithodoros turicata TaxID=34597 RepID=UPI003138F925